MTDNSKSLKVAVALAKDVIFSKETLENPLQKLNKENDYSVRFDLVWCNEQTSSDDEFDWSKYFYYETPIELLRKINEIHKPDLIICVFWGFFGSQQYFSESAEEEFKDRIAKDLTQKWIADIEFPATKILFFKETPSNNEISKKQYITKFRSQLYNTGVLDETKKSKLGEKILEIISKFVKIRFWDKPKIPNQGSKPFPPIRLKLPDGWLYLNKWLNDNSHLIGRELSEEDAEDFFNGKIPTFREIVSSTIPRRTINKDLKDFIIKAVNKEKFAVTLIHGAGGEGKSTILKQVASDLLLQPDLKIHVIYREGNANLSELIKILENKRENFVIVSDYDKEIIQRILDLAKRDSKPDNIQFFLESRTTHWEWQRNADSILQNNLGSYFQKRKIGILNESDAKEIVKAWEKANALGKLKDEKEPVKRLLKEAQLRSDKSGKQNSFFSSILWVRKHQTLDNRVLDIYSELEKRPSLNGKTLAHYYNYIIALHGDGIPILTNLVLREALGCDKTTLDDEILYPLKGETAILEQGALILVRHDVFAERAKFILKKPIFDEEGNFLYFDNPDYFNKFIGELAVAAEKLQREGKLGRIENDKWLALKDEYYKRNQPEVALFILKTLSEAFIYEPVLVTRWAKFLRVWGEDLREEAKILKRQKRLAEAQDCEVKSKEKLIEAANVFLNCYDKTSPQRSYFTEWGVIQGEIGNSFFSSWLTSISLMDGLKEKRHLAKPNMMELASLATAFSKSFLKTADNSSYSNIFKKATEGVFKLAFHDKAKRNIDFPEINEFKKFNIHNTERNLQTAFEKVNGNDVSKISLDDAFQSVLEGINLAWKLCEIERANLPESLPAAPDLKFDKLKKIFGIKTDNSRNENKTKQTVFKETKFPFFYDRDSKIIRDAEGLAVDLSDAILEVLKHFFEKDPKNITNQLTFAEIAEKYKKDLNNDDDEIEISRNFQRNLRDQLEEKYGLNEEKAKAIKIIKPWHGNGYQLGSAWNLSNTKRYIDALDRKNEELNENVGSQTDRRLTSKKLSSDSDFD
jgi:hypothetical protein